MIVEIEIPDLAELAGPDAFKDEDDPRVVGRAAISDLYFEEGDEIAREWGNAELVTMTGVGHSRIRQDERVIREATRFLSAR